MNFLHSLGSAENQRFRHCPRSLVFPRSAQILSANQCQICVQTARFSMELFDWLAVSHDTLRGRGCGWACACHNAKISLFCASKSSLTASYFRLIVSNLLSLHVQLPHTKAAFPAPKYCDTSPSERIVCCRISECKQNQRQKGRFERAHLIGWSNTRKMHSTWRSFGVKQYELGQCFAQHKSWNTDKWVCEFPWLWQNKKNPLFAICTCQCSTYIWRHGVAGMPWLPGLK